MLVLTWTSMSGTVNIMPKDCFLTINLLLGQVRRRLISEKEHNTSEDVTRENFVGFEWRCFGVKFDASPSLQWKK